MPRIQSLDLARGFTVLFIPAIHSVMLYSHPNVHHSWLGYCLTFIAEGPGAQLFMTIMGIVFTFKQHYSASAILLRVLVLLVTAYLLNVLKFAVPYALGVLPKELLGVLQVNSEQNILWQLVRMGDILHFAAIALLIMYSVYQARNYHIWATIILLTVLIGSLYTWDMHLENQTIDYLFSLFTGHPPFVFFPVLPWLMYPLMGMVIGYYCQKQGPRTISMGMWIGVCCTALGGLGIDTEANEYGFYRTTPFYSLIHIGIVLITLWCWQMIEKIGGDAKLFRVLSFCSRNITLIYLLQWVIICWCLPLVGYQSLNTFQSLLIAMYVSIITFTLTFLLTNKYKRHGHK